MAFESLDFETKFIIPTKLLAETVWNQVSSDLTNLYLHIRQTLIELHSTVAELGKTWYDNPIEISKLWFAQLQDYGVELYTRFNNEWKPQLQQGYETLASTTGDWLDQIKNTVEYAVEHPEQVTAETIEMLTETVSTVGESSSELVQELQEKSAEIIALLVEKPLNTLENAFMQTINSLLNDYFELINSVLASVNL